MSKISDYIRAVQDHFTKEANKPQTVEEFAVELSKPVETILVQLGLAGVKKSKGDLISESEKQALLKYLQKSHGSETANKKTITIKRGPSEAIQLWQAVADQKNGSAWDALDHFAQQVIWGQPIDPDLQRLINLIITKSIVEGALPSMKRGRPKSEDVEELGKDVAQAYWDMRDSGKSYADAVGFISEKIHKDERHIMRMVESNRSFVGETLEDRERKRNWLTITRQMRGDGNGYVSIYEEFLSPKLPTELEKIEFQNEDYVAHLEELIRLELKTKDC